MDMSKVMDISKFEGWDGHGFVHLKSSKNEKEVLDFIDSSNSKIDIPNIPQVIISLCAEYGIIYVLRSAVRCTPRKWTGRAIFRSFCFSQKMYELCHMSGVEPINS